MRRARGEIVSEHLLETLCTYEGPKNYKKKAQYGNVDIDHSLHRISTLHEIVSRLQRREVIKEPKYLAASYGYKLIMAILHVEHNEIRPKLLRQLVELIVKQKIRIKDHGNLTFRKMFPYEVGSISPDRMVLGLLLSGLYMDGMDEDIHQVNKLKKYYRKGYILDYGLVMGMWVGENLSQQEQYYQQLQSLGEDITFSEWVGYLHHHPPPSDISLFTHWVSSLEGPLPYDPVILSHYMAMAPSPIKDKIHLDSTPHITLMDYLSLSHHDKAWQSSVQQRYPEVSAYIFNDGPFPSEIESPELWMTCLVKAIEKGTMDVQEGIDRCVQYPCTRQHYHYLLSSLEKSKRYKDILLVMGHMETCGIQMDEDTFNYMRRFEAMNETLVNDIFLREGSIRYAKRLDHLVPLLLSRNHVKEAHDIIMSFSRRSWRPSIDVIEAAKLKWEEIGVPSYSERLEQLRASRHIGQMQIN